MLAAAVSTARAKVRATGRRGRLCQFAVRHAHASCARSRRTGARIPEALDRRVRRTASRIGRTTASASPSRAALRASSAADIFAFEDANHSTILFSGYSTMPCAARLLQPRNDVAHGGFVQNGVHRQPLLVAEVRNGGPLQRGQHAPAPPPGRSCARSASARLCPAR